MTHFTNADTGLWAGASDHSISVQPDGTGPGKFFNLLQQQKEAESEPLNGNVYSEDEDEEPFKFYCSVRDKYYRLDTFFILCTQEIKKIYIFGHFCGMTKESNKLLEKQNKIHNV